MVAETVQFFFQEVISCQENMAADISDYYGEKTCEEVTRYLTVHRNLLSHYRTLVSCCVLCFALCIGFNHSTPYDITSLFKPLKLLFRLMFFHDWIIAIPSFLDAPSTF